MSFAAKGKKKKKKQTTKQRQTNTPHSPTKTISINHTSPLNAILQGKLTSSDHLPVIIELSTKPIVKEGQDRYKFKTANWELFKEK